MSLDAQGAQAVAGGPRLLGAWFASAVTPSGTSKRPGSCTTTPIASA